MVAFTHGPGQSGSTCANEKDAASVLCLQGMLDDAIVTYKEAIAREPNFPEAYNNLVR